MCFEIFTRAYFAYVCITNQFCCTKNVTIKLLYIKCDQMRSKLRIWSYLLKKSLMENFSFCAVFFIFETLFKEMSITAMCN